MKIILFSAGLLSLGIGIIGIILPILPTTPFLLLTSFLFAKSSSKFEKKYKESKIYQKYLKGFIEQKKMTRKRKWTLLLTVDLMLLVSYLSIDILVLKIVILTLVLIKHLYFYKYIEIIE